MAGETMQGTRMTDNDGADLWPAGCYGRIAGIGWTGACPDGSYANLSAHEVTEHEDGTITVSPSILVSQGSRECWHGFLERGVWRSC